LNISINKQLLGEFVYLFNKHDMNLEMLEGIIALKNATSYRIEERSGCSHNRTQTTKRGKLSRAGQESSKELTRRRGKLKL
jgi:hypothetical protein